MERPDHLLRRLDCYLDGLLRLGVLAQPVDGELQEQVGCAGGGDGVPVVRNERAEDVLLVELSVAVAGGRCVTVPKVGPKNWTTSIGV
ncbi:MAG: hypothetical protein OXJ55_09140 [Caldilineaceae bacterium]|nr:hypothetical protein [Caldilineaceae bacterium]